MSEFILWCSFMWRTSWKTGNVIFRWSKVFLQLVTHFDILYWNLCVWWLFFLCYWSLWLMTI